MNIMTLMRKMFLTVISFATLVAAPVAVIAAAAVLFTGCGRNDGPAAENLSKMDFTVMSYDDIPRELLTEIDKRKNDDLRLTYRSEGWLYIARGYGKQRSGGYSIAVRELSGADNAVYFDSELIGPRSGEAVNKLPTYPFIVIKTEDSGQNVVFR